MTSRPFVHEQDPQLEAIKQKRLAELGQQGGMPQSAEEQAQQQAQAEAAAEQRSIMLAALMDPKARERRACSPSFSPRPSLSAHSNTARAFVGITADFFARASKPHPTSSATVSRIAIVKPEKAQALENMLLQVSGRIVSER